MSEGKVAPHEGNEIKLIFKGLKPLAVIELRKNEAAYRRAFEYDELGYLVAVRRNGTEGPELIVVMHKNTHLISEYLFLLENGVSKYGIKEYHRRMGKLFGYSPADIEAFIKADVQCDCAKCTGSSV